MMKKLHVYMASALLISLVLSSCDSFLDITPTGKVIAKTADEYRALLNYEYKNFPEDRGLTMMRTDEIALSKAGTSAEDLDAYFDIWTWNDMAPQASTVDFGWRRYYHTLYIANYVIEHEKEITAGDAETISQLIGESYMLRAYCHFLLVNLYGTPYTVGTPAAERGIPLQLKADVNAVLKPSTVEDVYKQVLADIGQAAKYMTVDKWETGLNYRFSRLSIPALKARVCLYMGNWEEALDAAREVINLQPELTDLTQSGATLPNSFKSVENILALEQNLTAAYRTAGRPSKTILDMYRVGDMRKRAYYKAETSSISVVLKGGGNEFRCSFRTGEQYLIAAEAAAQSGKLEEARKYLSHLMKYRYVKVKYNQYAGELNALTKAQLLETIARERACELAFEGHRWFDLRRTARPRMVREYEGKTYEIKENDSRYTLRYPTDAVEANPNLEQK